MIFPKMNYEDLIREIKLDFPADMQKAMYADVMSIPVAMHYALGGLKS